MAVQSTPRSSELALRRIRDNITMHFGGEDASRLDLSDCNLQNIPDEARECNWVTHLDLSNNRIFSDIYQVSWWDLRAIDLSFTAVSDLSALSRLDKLEQLMCAYTPVSDLRPIAKLRNLHTLKCYSTPVSDLSPLQDLIKLQVLNASATQVSDLSPLRAFIQSNRRRITLTGTTDEGVFDFKDCPLTNPPVEVVAQGNEAMLGYWEGGAKETPISNFDQVRLDMHQWRYPGLRPFERSESHLFYGRAKETEEFSKAVLDHPVSILYGESGVGKTSLLQAGCGAYWLEQQFIPLFCRLDKIDHAPFQILESTLINRQDEFEIQHKLEPAQNSSISLWELLKMLQIQNGVQCVPVIVFDQFEDFFNLGHSESSRNMFFSALAKVLQGVFSEELQQRIMSSFSKGLMTEEGRNWWLKPPDFRFVFCLRHNFLNQILAVESLTPSRAFRMELPNLSLGGVHQAIVYPPQIDGGTFVSPIFSIGDDAESEMLDVLTNYNREAVKLHELQLLCQIIEDDIVDKSLPSGFVVQPEFYGGIEGLRNFLGDPYQEILLQLTEQDRIVARNLLEKGLVGSDDLPLSVANHVLKSEFGASQELLDTLVKIRLLRTTVQKGQLYYELGDEVPFTLILKSRETRLRQEIKESKRQREAEEQRQQSVTRLTARLNPAPPKYILAIEGGSTEIWGQLALLAALEQRMARETENKDYRLSDTFDLIGGAGLANFVAMQLSLGRKAFEIFEDFKNVLQALDPGFPNDVPQSLALLSNLYLDQSSSLDWKTVHYFIDISANGKLAFLASWTSDNQDEMRSYTKYLIENVAQKGLANCPADIILLHIAAIDPHLLGWPLGESNLHILSLQLPNQFIVAEQALESIKQSSPRRNNEDALHRLAQWIYTGHQGQSPLGIAPANLHRLNWPSGYSMRYASSDWAALHDAAQSIVMKTDLSAFVPKSVA